jgi:hypothetical protein
MSDERPRVYLLPYGTTYDPTAGYDLIELSFTPIARYEDDQEELNTVESDVSRESRGGGGRSQR